MDVPPTTPGALQCQHRENIALGQGVFISPGCEITANGPVAIGDDCVLGAGVKIQSEPARPVSIGARVWLGDNVRVNPGSSIGEGAVICASSEISGAVASNAVIRGTGESVLRYCH